VVSAADTPVSTTTLRISQLKPLLCSYSGSYRRRGLQQQSTSKLSAKSSVKKAQFTSSGSCSTWHTENSGVQTLSAHTNLSGRSLSALTWKGSLRHFKQSSHCAQLLSGISSGRSVSPISAATAASLLAAAATGLSTGGAAAAAAADVLEPLPLLLLLLLLALVLLLLVKVVKVAALPAVALLLLRFSVAAAGPVGAVLVGALRFLAVACVFKTVAQFVDQYKASRHCEGGQ
jgi:hypothetical protein